MKLPKVDKRYLPALLTAYQEALDNYLKENTGRNYYRHVRDILEKIHQWEGGKESVKEIIRHLSIQFKARKALIEELGKLSV